MRLPPPRPHPNEPLLAYSPGGDIVAWFAESCRRFPSNACVEWRAKSVTYAQLEKMVREIARRLEFCQLGRGDVVVVFLSDRIALIAAMIALFQRRCVFVPLDPDAPPERAIAMVVDGRPAALLTERMLRRHAAALRELSGIEFTLVDISEEPTVAARAPRADVAHPTVAYIYYTSGSTGRPKGVMGSIEAVSQFIRWEVETFGIESGWRVSQFTPPTFDPFFRDVFVPLCTGGTVLIPPAPPSELTPEDLVGWLCDQGVHLIHTVPSILAALAKAAPHAGRPETLRRVFVAGEVLRSSLVRRWWSRFGKGATLVNLYGSTETTMIKLFHVVGPRDLARPTVPIGRPIDGAEVLVLDEAENLCPSGVVGEICIRSPFLALGYHRNPSATRAVYAPDPFCSEPDTVLYRSGDFGRFLPDGSLELVGRKDDLVKVRGVRVDLGEIEVALERHPGVREAAIACQPDRTGDNRLVAYLVLSTADPISPADLRVHLRRHLPWEMIPAEFVFLDALPRTPNGKVNRPVLTGCRSETHATQPCQVRPRREVERLLAGIWCELLGLESVGVHDNFLDLGGHSLTAMRVASCWKELTGTALPLVAILEHPTIAELADYLGGDREVLPTADPASPGPRAEHSCKRPCNLVIVVNEQVGRSSFERLAKEVETLDPNIRAVVTDDSPNVRLDLAERATLVFSPALIRNPSRFPGRILCGCPLTKSEEYSALATKGLPVPAWEVVTRERDPDLSTFGPYVVCKPNDGAKGAAVKLMRRDRVSWKPIFTAASGMSNELIVQEYIFTGPRATSYRITTLFGHTLYAIRILAGAGRPPLLSPKELESGRRPPGVSIVSNTPDSEIELASDADVIALAESAHTAFPQIPLLGVDILREEPSGRLFIIEVNAIGYNWNFAGSGRRTLDAPIEQQFDGLRKAARILAEQTQRLALPTTVPTVISV